MLVIETLSLFSFRLYMQTRTFTGAGDLGAIIGGVLNAISIMVMNMFWRKIAEILTRWGKLQCISTI